MAVKKYTLVIMPSSPGKRVVRFCLSSICWQFFLLMVAGVLFWACLGVWGLYQHKQMSRQTLLLSEENQRARIRLIEKRAKVNYLNKQLKRLQEQADYIRKFLGLEHSGKTKGMTGQGGVAASPQAFSFHSDMFFREKERLQDASGTSPESCLTADEMNQLNGDIDRIRRTLESAPG